MSRLAIVGAATVVAYFIAPFATAQTPSGAPPGVRPAAQAVVVGCVAPTADGFLLKATSGSGTSRRSGGSTSPKGSTPIPISVNTAALTETRGSNSAKASTPLGAGSGATGSRTSGATTAKGSVSIVGRTPGDATYELEADSVQLSAHAYHLVEISGSILQTEASATMQKLKVEQVKVVSSTCAQ
jgi:hypothetical protein